MMMHEIESIKNLSILLDVEPLCKFTQTRTNIYRHSLDLVNWLGKGFQKDHPKTRSVCNVPLHANIPTHGYVRLIIVTRFGATPPPA